MKNMSQNRIITGSWDGRPIYRERTSGEELADLIDRDLKSKGKAPDNGDHDCHLSEEDGCNHESHERI